MSKVGWNILEMVGEFIQSIPDSWDTSQQVEAHFRNVSPDLVGEIAEKVDRRLIQEGKSIQAYARAKLVRKHQREQSVKQFAMDVSGAKTSRDVTGYMKKFLQELEEIDNA